MYTVTQMQYQCTTILAGSWPGWVGCGCAWPNKGKKGAVEAAAGGSWSCTTATSVPTSAPLAGSSGQQSSSRTSSRQQLCSCGSTTASGEAQLPLHSAAAAKLGLELAMQSKRCDTIWHWQIQRLEILWSLLARTVRIMHASHRKTYALRLHTVLIRLQIRSLASSPPSPAGLSPSLVRVSVPSMRCPRCPCRCRRPVGRHGGVKGWRGPSVAGLGRGVQPRRASC